MDQNSAPQIEFDENGVPKGSSSIPIQNFFFLVFYSDPSRERVYVYPDGDEHRIMMKHDSFLDLIILLTGYDILPRIHEALSTYGTFWIYDREGNSLRRISMRNSDDIRTIQGQIQKALRRETKPDTNPINPAEGMAYTPMDVTIPQGKNPFERDSDVEDGSSSPSIRIKK